MPRSVSDCLAYLDAGFETLIAPTIVHRAGDARTRISHLAPDVANSEPIPCRGRASPCRHVLGIPTYIKGYHTWVPR